MSDKEKRRTGMRGRNQRSVNSTFQPDLANCIQQHSIVISQRRSQELPTYYRVNGAIYLLDLNLFKKNNSLFHHANTFAYVMDRSHSVDIDVELDFAIAEAILKGS